MVLSDGKRQEMSAEEETIPGWIGEKFEASYVSRVKARVDCADLNVPRGIDEDYQCFGEFFIDLGFGVPKDAIHPSNIVCDPKVQ